MGAMSFHRAAVRPKVEVASMAGSSGKGTFIENLSFGLRYGTIVTSPGMQSPSTSKYLAHYIGHKVTTLGQVMFVVLMVLIIIKRLQSIGMRRHWRIVLAEI